MSTEYRNNHYVPRWYQRRFIPSDQRNQELYYLDLKPKTFRDPQGIARPRKALKKQGFRFCFVERDLYTTQFEGIESKLEELFFGAIDNNGKHALDYFTEFTHPSTNADAFHNMILYMSTQKLRTPKGLAWLSKEAGAVDHLQTLDLMVRLRHLYGAIWTECIWQIADASESATKLIISDHPVTIYNKRFGPREVAPGNRTGC